MNKHELIDFLEPFMDETEIVVRGANKNLMAPITYELSYVPATELHAALVAINIKGSVVCDTGQMA